MSVAEIKEEVRKLSPEQLGEIEALISELRRDGVESSKAVRELKASDPEFRAAADHVFTHYGDLLRRLAE